jgi:hypothetical protein
MRGPLGRQIMTVQKAIKLAEQILPGAAAPDGERDPRWQAIIEIGTYIESDPDPVWEFVARWGSYRDEDLQSAIATCLLEHLLQHHFDLLFPRVEKLVKANRLFAMTFTMCWKLGQAELSDNARRFDALQAQVLGPAA